jgi:hypothetical protein
MRVMAIITGDSIVPFLIEDAFLWSGFVVAREQKAGKWKEHNYNIYR